MGIGSSNTIADDGEPKITRSHEHHERLCDDIRTGHLARVHLKSKNTRQGEVTRGNTESSCGLETLKSPVPRIHGVT